MVLLKKKILKSPLGNIIAVADETQLYHLEFEDRFEPEAPASFGSTKALDQIEEELIQFFEGKLKGFKTPLCYQGTPFQVDVWKELQKIPYGKTCSYAELAAGIGRPTAYRAAAQANGANRFLIIVPCHRVINSDGKLGGYSSGLERKRWLLDHEKKSN